MSPTLKHDLDSFSTEYLVMRIQVREQQTYITERRLTDGATLDELKQYTLARIVCGQTEPIDPANGKET